MQGTVRTLVFMFVIALEMVAAKADDIPPALAAQSESSPAINPPVTETPQSLFQIACFNCQNGNQRLAGRRIRRGVKLMKKETKHATKKGKEALERSIDELEVLAAKIEKGTASSIKEIKATFARAQHALAYHHQQRAVRSRLQKNFRQAGDDLRAAADNVAFGLSWAGEGVQTKSHDVIVATRDLGGSLAGGTKVGVQRVDAQFKAFGLEIKRFGRKIIQPIRR